MAPKGPGSDLPGFLWASHATDLELRSCQIRNPNEGHTHKKPNKSSLSGQKYTQKRVSVAKQKTFGQQLTPAKHYGENYVPILTPASKGPVGSLDLQPFQAVTRHLNVPPPIILLSRAECGSGCSQVIKLFTPHHHPSTVSVATTRGA